MSKPDEAPPTSNKPDTPSGQAKKGPKVDDDLPIDPSTGKPHKKGEVPLGRNEPL